MSRRRGSFLLHILLACLFFTQNVRGGYGDDLCNYRGNTGQWTIYESSDRIQMAEGVEIRTDSISVAAPSADEYAYAWKQISLTQQISTIIILTDYRHEIAAVNADELDLVLTDLDPSNSGPVSVYNFAD